MNLLKVFFSLFFCFLIQVAVGQSISFKSLTCDSQKNPLTIENQQPVLSWVVNAAGYNRSQTAYQVLVATSPNKLSEKDYDMWNSGKVHSTQSTFVKYQGRKLMPTQQYWWKVKIWDENGIGSDWSQACTFEMGLMNEDQWKDAHWISLGKDTRTSEHRFREYKTGRMKEPVIVTSQAVGYFRNEIETSRNIKSARVYICGLGYYELYINGRKTGDHILDPAPSNYNKQAYYVSYDVTSQIREGRNAIGIVLGNGFYGQNISWKHDPESEKDLSFGEPSVRMLLKIIYTDGAQQNILTNDDWKNTTGPIVFDNIYGGEIYDARFEINGWNTVGYNDREWDSVKIVTPEVKKISAQQIPPIRKLYEFVPQRVFRSSRGKWIVDFGQNIAGWVQIKVQGKKGQEIKIITTEALTQDGKDIYRGSTGGGANGMAQCLKYVCKGEGVETWAPRFTYHGFRYAQIDGISAKPTAEMIKAIVVATDMQQTGNFSCSDPLLNKMDTISKWTIIDNMHGIPEDCPHREKCGWLGDAHAFCEYALYNYDLLSFYKKYLEDIRTQRKLVDGNNKDGKKYLVPTMIAPGKRTSTIAKLDWGVAAVYLPWYNYRCYGDSSIVTGYYSDMKELTNYYLTFKDSNGIIQNGMGDWCPPRWDRKRNPSAMECHPVVSANAYFYDILGIMQLFAEMNNDKAYAEKMAEERESLLQAFNDAYLETIPMTTFQWYGSQTATVMALQFGMVPKEKLTSVVQGLRYNIIAVKGVHHAVGIHGMRYIYTVLNNTGNADLAYSILTTPSFPSQTYVMNYGFTTWPERQFYWDAMEGLSNSLNHPMHSGFAAYFFESLGGIKSSYNKPGYKEFTVNPVFPSGISHVSVSIPSPYGTIHNNWEMKNDVFLMNLEIPFNTTARIVVNKKELKTLKINRKPWADYAKLNDIDGNTTSVLLGSGVYTIEYLK